MSRIVTHPDIVNEAKILLLVNAEPDDIKMVTYWLSINREDYTIHLYHDGIDDISWLQSVANIAEKILADRRSTCIESLYDNIAKITWIGKHQNYATALDYLAKHGRTNKRIPANIV